MKVVQVIPAIGPAFGGPSTVAVDVNLAVRARGHDARLISTDIDRGGGRLTAGQLADLHRPGSAIIVCPPSRPRGLQNSWSLLRRLWRESADADLIHVDGQYMLPHVYAYVVARLRHVPYGIQPHGTLDPYQLRRSSRVKSVYNRLIGRRIVAQAQYLLFTSREEAERSAPWTRPEQRRIVPLGFSRQEPVPVERLIDRLSSVPRSGRVLFLGRLAHKKRPDLLLRAWAAAQRDSSHLLIVAGPEDDFSTAALRALADSLGVTDSVLFAGELSSRESSWLYGQAGVFVLPSENENFALTVVEAMAWGCHVITTQFVAAADYLGRAGAGHVLTSLSGSELTDALSTALADTELQERSGAAAQRFAETEITWDPMVDFLRDAAGAGTTSAVAA